MDLREAESIDRVTAAVSQLLKGRTPPAIRIEDQPEGEIRQLSEYVNRLIAEWSLVNESALALSEGNIDNPVRGNTPVANSLKALHATLRHLTWQTGQIAKGDFTQRVDFLGDFSASFNWMVEQLDSYRARVRRESYDSGMAEMASGVLHNIRNTLHPIATGLSEIEGIVDSLPRENIKRALTELETEASPGRREALLKLLHLGTRKTLREIDTIKSGLRDLSRQAMMIEVILADCDRFSHLERAVEPLGLRAAIQDALELVPESMRSVARIQIDDSLKTTPRVLAERVVLAQVFSNLVINAIESIQRNRKMPGVIRISASVVDQRDRNAVQTTIEDNGEGILRQDLARIFDRGFSTKETPSGIGLHWCCNALHAMKGDLTAESDGAGCGSRFRVVIPCGAPTDAGGTRP